MEKDRIAIFYSSFNRSNYYLCPALKTRRQPALLTLRTKIMDNSIKAIRVLDALGILIILIIVALSSFFQYKLHELPCALCIMQRFGILAMAYGLLLNLRYGFRSSHYALSMLAALYTAAVAACQELMHILPGSSTYAKPLFGHGLYTWVFIFSVAFIVVCLLLLLWNKQFKRVHAQQKQSFKICNTLFVIALLLTLLNIVNTFSLCGFKACPSDPKQYKYFF